MYYQIEYYNKLWKDWLAFDQLFYKNEKDAQSVINSYKQNNPNIQTRIIQTTILDEKPKRVRSTNIQRVRAEKL